MTTDRKYVSVPPQQSTPSARTWRCVAHGCSVLAGIDFGNQGETICRFHSGAKAAGWDEITKVLKRWEWLVAIADHCASKEWTDDNPDWPERATAYCNAHDSPGLAPKWLANLGKKTVHERDYHMLYAQRMNGILGALVSDPRAASLQQLSDRHKEHIRKIGEILRSRIDPELAAERAAIQAEGA